MTPYKTLTASADTDYTEIDKKLKSEGLYRAKPHVQGWYFTVRTPAGKSEKIWVTDELKDAVREKSATADNILMASGWSSKDPVNNLSFSINILDVIDSLKKKSSLRMYFERYEVLSWNIPPIKGTPIVVLDLGEKGSDVAAMSVTCKIEVVTVENSNGFTFKPYVSYLMGNFMTASEHESASRDFQG